MIERRQRSRIEMWHSSRKHTSRIHNNTRHNTRRSSTRLCSRLHSGGHNSKRL